MRRTIASGPKDLHSRIMTNRRALTAAVLIVAAAGAALLLMGRHPICTCGAVELWVGSRDSPRTSQMLADWYSFSHVVHGLLFYAALWLVARRWPAEWRFVMALLIEAAWEVAENTPLVIDRYRATTAALGYTGQRAQFPVRHCYDVAGFRDRAQAARLDEHRIADRAGSYSIVCHPR